LASCGVKLVASLPDNWIMDVIKTIERDDRFVHVPVNREESAIGLCSGAYMGGMGSAALMGASGFMTVVYALTKINYTYVERYFPALKASNAPGHTFVVLEVEPFSEEEQKLEQPPFDGPELKFRFGRHVESLTGCSIFGYRF
jgi:hypothetical protein